MDTLDLAVTQDGQSFFMVGDFALGFTPESDRPIRLVCSSSCLSTLMGAEGKGRTFSYCPTCGMEASWAENLIDITYGDARYEYSIEEAGERLVAWLDGAGVNCLQSYMIAEELVQVATSLSSHVRQQLTYI